MYKLLKLSFRCEPNLRFVRHSHKKSHWSVSRKKKQATDRALEHFDEFYNKVFGKRWDNMRAALLSKHKYVAVLNNYSDIERISAELENKGALNMKTLFDLEKQYIKEKQTENKRTADLERIFKMDRDTEREKEKTVKPPVLEQKKEDGDNKASEFSLQSSMNKAEFDTSRIIDVKNVDSIASLYEFVPATKIKGKEDWVLESDYYNFYDKSELPVQIEKEYDLHFPEHLKIYCYEEGNDSDWKAPKNGSTGVSDYFLLDGASVLPVLALGIKPGDRIFDLCAAPGGKSYTMLQTLYPQLVVCNDIQQSRVNRIYQVFDEFFYDLEERWLNAGRLRITMSDARFTDIGHFNRILVDVPCTTDRHSVTENDNNIFKGTRIKERLKLPEIQFEILYNALKLVLVGGTVVYSTCTLSPIQNDGVVHMTLKRVWEDTNIEVIVKDLSPALKQTKSVYRLANQKLLRYGHLVIPDLGQNYGPMYFCKLQRVK